jgi:hypothetical protein
VKTNVDRRVDGKIGVSFSEWLDVLECGCRSGVSTGSESEELRWRVE